MFDTLGKSEQADPNDHHPHEPLDRKNTAMPFFVSQADIDRDHARISELEQGNDALRHEIDALQHEMANLREFHKVSGADDAQKLQQFVSSLRVKEKSLTGKIDSFKVTITDLEMEQPDIDYSLLNLETVADTVLNLDLENRAVIDSIKAMVKDGKHASWRTTLVGLSGTRKTDVNSVVNGLSKLAARAFNADATAILEKVTATNYEASLDRLYRAAKSAETAAKSINFQFYKQYIKAWAVQLKIQVEIQKARALQKDLEREHKAELREAAKVERELAAERAKLEKELAHYQNLLARLAMEETDDRAIEIRAKIEEIQKSIDNVDYREANQRAGYVYVISNIGSFGERMVKIGLTRRLNPIERVQELSDASVPFNFDVHALFFADDAVSVETELHHRFAEQRVNLVNARREFFAVSPAQVKEALTEISGALVEFTELPEAEQYRESLRLAGRE